MTIMIDLGQAIHALSDALDLVGVDELFHGKRVAAMAWQCGHGLGLSESEMEDLFHVGLLHDCGVSSTYVHRCLVDELDWEGSDFHCAKGAKLLGQVPPLAHLAPIVRYHHIHWNAFEPLVVSPVVARFANLIHLVDRVDALMGPYYNQDPLLARHAIRDRVRGLGDSFFAPELVTVFLDLSDSEAFWLSLEPHHLIRFIYEWERKNRLTSIGFSDLRQLALMFAQIVDAKSSYTMEHSLGTARLARFLAEQMELPAEVCAKIEIAGLLHDLGKLRVPDEILEKTGALTREERSLIKRHSFETYQILRGVLGLEDIALWAAYHHEKPDGRGYPFHCRGTELTLEMRLIAVSDVFQALAQCRPYRGRLSPTEILRMLRACVGRNQLDGEVVELVGRHLDQSWRLATGQGVGVETV